MNLRSKCIYSRLTFITYGVKLITDRVNIRTGTMGEQAKQEPEGCILLIPESDHTYRGKIPGIVDAIIESCTNDTSVTNTF